MAESVEPDPESLPRTSTPRRFDGVLAMVVALGAAVRFAGIATQSLWYDEVATRVIVTTPLASVFTELRMREGTPPLYFAFASAWVRMFGAGDGTLRAFSALVGTLAIPVVYLAAREFGCSRRIARIAAVLIAVNPFLVWYSQEARAYSLLVLLAAAMLWTFARAQRRVRTTDTLWFGIISALALATHYFAVFLIIPMWAALLITRHREWRRILVGFVPVAVFAVPLGLLAIDQQSRNLQEWITAFAFDFRVRESLRHLLVGPAVPRPWLWTVVACAAIFGIVLALLAPDRHDRSTASTLTIVGLVALALPALTAAVGTDYFLDRNVIAALVPLAVAAAVGLGGPRFRPLGTVLVGAVIVASVATTVAVARESDLQRADWREVSSVIMRDRAPQVIVMNTGRVVGSAMSRYLPPTRELPSRATIRTKDLVFIGVEPVPAQCSWWFGRACALIYLSEHPQVPLASSFSLVHVDHVGRLLVTRYRSPEPVRVGPRNLVTRSDRAGSMVMAVARPHARRAPATRSR